MAARALRTMVLENIFAVDDFLLGLSGGLWNVDYYKVARAEGGELLRGLNERRTSDDVWKNAARALLLSKGCERARRKRLE